MPSVEDVLGLGFALMVVGGFATGMLVMIARLVARQRIAENLFRERLARHWAAVGPIEPPPAA